MRRSPLSDEEIIEIQTLYHDKKLNIPQIQEKTGKSSSVIDRYIKRPRLHEPPKPVILEPAIPLAIDGTDYKVSDCPFCKTPLILVGSDVVKCPRCKKKLKVEAEAPIEVPVPEVLRGNLDTYIASLSPERIAAVKKQVKEVENYLSNKLELIDIDYQTPLSPIQAIIAEIKKAAYLTEHIKEIIICENGDLDVYIKDADIDWGDWPIYDTYLDAMSTIIHAHDCQFWFSLNRHCYHIYKWKQKQDDPITVRYEKSTPAIPIPPMP